MTTRAMTLAELLVATTIVGIIMLGVVASDHALRKNAQSQGAGALLTINTRAVVNHIIQNASIATGDKATSLGFDFPFNAAFDIVNNDPAKSFCVRQDIDLATQVPNDGSSIDYDDDQWACYTIVAFNLRTCNKAVKDSFCLASDALVGPVVSLQVKFDDTTNVFSVIVVNRDQPGYPKSISNPQVTVDARVSPPGQSI